MVLRLVQHQICPLMSGGRWRTVEHWVSRARMALHMTEQLDLAGRTGEMARPWTD